jgi:hypothetical protein
VFPKRFKKSKNKRFSSGISLLLSECEAPDADKQRSTDAGYQAYLVKPARPVDLIGAVAVLARHSTLKP